MLIALKRLKLGTSNSTAYSYGTTWSLIFFEKGAWPGSRDPLIFWTQNANSSNMAKPADFKFDKHVYGDCADMAF